MCEFCIKHFDWLIDIWERTHNCLLYFKFSRLSKLLFSNRFFPLISNPKIQMKKDRRPCHKCTLRCNPYSCVAPANRWEVLIMFYLTEQRNLLTKGLSGPFNYALPKIRYYWQLWSSNYIKYILFERSNNSIHYIFLVFCLQTSHGFWKNAKGQNSLQGHPWYRDWSRSYRWPSGICSLGGSRRSQKPLPDGVQMQEMSSDVGHSL